MLPINAFLREQIALRNTQHALLEVRLTETEDEIEDLHGRIELLEMRNSELQSQNKALEQRILRLTSQLQKLVASNGALDDEAIALLGELARHPHTRPHHLARRLAITEAAAEHRAGWLFQLGYLYASSIGVNGDRCYYVNREGLALLEKRGRLQDPAPSSAAVQ